ncbi:phosphoglycerate mutase-like protein [Cucurbitaria berberidis CBS 394.84]|uniref:Phosphoglycerate mutase-like protein n=1 Tax=Cucurbitaria berberidis CBS 394.84 TaxID=1168544 RepID=A0A9P4GQQ5_9PLEO|nr:phosphoglycerate mutase-like protein [Cucurbitaria berberidis CBS 394.84]KAF1850873.1 phosphoglycerate mutase-like protein [Cucurbitaria berberidis CBS 394.84]
MKVTTLSALSMLAGAEAAETILGAYIFHRHGDRTPKALAPTNLTSLGYEQVYTSGSYYRSRYLSGDSKIRGMNKDTVKLSQLSVTAPVDNVLQNSAMGFLQGLYPPVQTVQTLANGKNVQAPMDGYQLIPVNTVSTGAGSEDAGWLQDASSCQNAKTSSNAFFDSKEYKDRASGTKDFYSSIVPSINNVISEDQVTFKNAYVVYDIINVAKIHNSSIPSSDVLTNSTLLQLRTLADAHEWGLAYNASDSMRAVSGMQLAGEVLKYMNDIISSKGSKKFGVQFGAYATFLSFFGLVDLPKTNTDFTGVVDYASSMSFELFTDSDVSGGFPSADDLQVRFLFHNGTASNSSQPTVYPLFGGTANTVSFNDFQNNLNKFAISTTEQWCTKCGNSTGSCAAYANNANNGASTQANSSGSGLSPAIGGVIGAFVTLAVVLGALVAFMLIGGFRLVSKKRLASGGVQGTNTEPKA